MTYIPEEVRRQIRSSARGRCEYCLYGEIYAMRSHEFDHIYAEKHGGQTLFENLCLSCLDCNRYKGSDLCSLDTVTGIIVTLFHPRQHKWQEHFRLNNAMIEGLTPQGRVTVRLLRFNNAERVAERTRLIKLKRYP